MIAIYHPVQFSAARRGLAPLELVLSLPLLLMVMGLMVFFGNATYWKLRGLSVARQAAWSHRWPRDGDNELPPRHWPQAGQLASNPAAAFSDLDPPSLRHPVVRGPLDNGFVVRDELLDFSRGAQQGEAQLTRTPAMLPSLGDFRYELTHPLLDDKFPYAQMDIPRNLHRRIPFLYELPKAGAGLSGAYSAAVRAAVRRTTRPDLDVLDRDDELRAFFGSYIDFYPRVQSFCEIDVAAVGANEVAGLIDRIRGSPGPPRIASVPEVMASTFLSMYQQQLDAIQSQIQQLQSQGTPGANAQIAGLQAQTAPLQTNIAQLTAFLNSLP